MNYFEKKQWIRMVLCVIVLLGISLYLSGVIGGEHLTYNLRTGSVKGTDAEASEKGFGGMVAVHAVLDGQKVLDLTVDTPDETEGLGKKCSEAEFTAQFIGKEGPFTYGENGVEAISGATVTSNAVLKALNRAITGESAAEAEEPAAETEAPAEKTEEPAAETEAPAEKTEEPAAEAEKPAAEASEQGFAGTVTVHAVLDGKKVLDLTVDTPDETEGLGKRCSEKEFTAQFIGKEGPFAYGENGIDAVTGATITSNAVLKALNGVIPGEPAAEAPAEKTEEPAAEAEKPAAEASEQGFAGTVTVHAVLDGKKVLDLTVDTPDETEGLGKKCSEAEFTAQFIGKEGPFAYGENGIDAVTGATITSNAVLKALNGIIPGEPAAEAPAEKTEEPAAEASEQGFAGTVTIHAVLDGKKVLDLTVDTPDETEGLGKRCSEKEFTAQFIGKEGPFAYGENGIDAVTGATITSNAVLKALNGVIPGEPAAEAPAEKTEEPAAEVKEPAAEAEEKTSGSALPAAVLRGVTVSMGDNDKNNVVTSYLEEDPYLKNIYEGYGFAKDYGSARGHTYTLEDVAKTERPHPKANCITCKTDDFARLVNTEGVGVYSMPFDDVFPRMTTTISCYTCHSDGMGADGKPAVSHSYVNTALGASAGEINPAVLVCGQCHIEYYFTPSDSETMMPYHSAAEMTPAAILAYYDAMDFADWTQPSTGTRMLKAQHPEMETVLGSAHYAKTGMTCADCHMPMTTAETGESYRSHYLVSPLQSEALLATCAKCHGSAENTITLVKTTQEKVTAREKTVGNRLSQLKDALAAAVAENKLGETELEAVRKLYREAQWYFDFCYVENSEGAHNSTLSLSCLDTSEGLIDEAMLQMGVQQ